MQIAVQIFGGREERVLGYKTLVRDLKCKSNKMHDSWREMYQKDATP